jgi:hypothetical protein
VQLAKNGRNDAEAYSRPREVRETVLKLREILVSSAGPTGRHA